MTRGAPASSAVPDQGFGLSIARRMVAGSNGRSSTTAPSRRACPCTTGVPGHQHERCAPAARAKPRQHRHARQARQSPAPKRSRRTSAGRRSPATRSPPAARCRRRPRRPRDRRWQRQRDQAAAARDRRRRAGCAGRAGRAWAGAPGGGTRLGRRRTGTEAGDWSMHRGSFRCHEPLCIARATAPAAKSARPPAREAAQLRCGRCACLCGLALFVRPAAGILAREHRRPSASPPRHGSRPGRRAIRCSGCCPSSVAIDSASWSGPRARTAASRASDPRAVGVPGDRPGRDQTCPPGQRRQLRSQDAQRGRAARDAGQRPADDDRPILVAEPAARAAQLSPAAARRIRRHHGRRSRPTSSTAWCARRRAARRSTSCPSCRALPCASWALPVRARPDRRGRRGRRRAEGRPPPHDRASWRRSSRCPASSRRPRTCASARRCARWIGWCCR